MVFNKRNRKHVRSMFLSSYRDTHEGLGEVKKAVKTLACSSGSKNNSRSPKLPLVFLSVDRNMVHVFYFLNTKHANMQHNF